MTTLTGGVILKRLRGRLAAAVTAVILAACVGMSSYAAEGGEERDPILYTVTTAAEGKEYPELTPAPEQKENSEGKEPEAAEKKEEPANTGSSENVEVKIEKTAGRKKPLAGENPAGEKIEENSDDAQDEDTSEDGEDTSEDGEDTSEDGEDASEGSEDTSEDGEDASEGSEDKEDSKPEEKKEAEPDSADQAENAEPADQPENQILVIAIPDDEAYNLFDTIKLTVQFQVEENPTRTADIHLGELNSVNTDKGMYYVVEYKIGEITEEQIASVKAEGISLASKGTGEAAQENGEGTTAGAGEGTTAGSGEGTTAGAGEGTTAGAGEGTTAEADKGTTAGSDGGQGGVSTVTETENAAEELTVVKGSVKEIPAGETTTADAAATASTAEETVVEEEESKKGGIPWIPIAIGGVALAGIGAAAAVFLLRNKKQQPEKKAAAEPAMVFSTCSELRVVEERRDGSRTYYRFDLNGRQTARLADLQNRKDGRMYMCRLMAKSSHSTDRQEAAKRICLSSGRRAPLQRSRPETEVFCASCGFPELKRIRDSEGQLIESIIHTYGGVALRIILRATPPFFF